MEGVVFGGVRGNRQPPLAMPSHKFVSLSSRVSLNSLRHGSTFKHNTNLWKITSDWVTMLYGSAFVQAWVGLDEMHYYQ